MKLAFAFLLAVFFSWATLAQNSAPQPSRRLEELQDKTILLFTPHPDDDVFGAGGTIALLNCNHNRIYIVVYTNDDKGSYDPDMNSQRLAQIRRSEQEVSEALLGTPKQNILWMGYDDGMLEYAAQPKLTEEATAIIRRIRPDVLLSVDPGQWYEGWHKTDHRMAAFNTIDAVRAAEFWLYFPNQKLQQGLQPYKVPEMYFFYPSAQEASYFVNIDSVVELKIDAAMKQVSQFEPAINKYRPDWDPNDLAKAKQELRAQQTRKDGHYVEPFRYATGFNQY
ncbi:MAG TPA: PIG-L family deacetylase [Candidatus Eremiobacteraceae bacterium]|nr:PIG-L family deacetylase [Candidatus Eremiobacteraceae bacterium]